MPVRVSVPWPPTVNRLYRIDRATGRHVLSAEGRAYENSVAWQLRLHRIEPIEGLVAVTLDCYPPDNRRRDLDNVLKAVFDTLTKGRVWGDDSQVKRIEATMHEPARPGRVELTVARRDG